MNRLIQLYPREWRERYGEEFAAVLEEVSGQRHRLWLAFDVVRGAADAHLRGRLGMRRFWNDAALRRGLFDGLIISGVIAVFVVLTNVVFPGGPDDSDADPEYMIQYLIILAVLAGLLIAIGARGRRRAGTVVSGAKAGGTAGGVIAGMVTLTFLTVNNLFLDIVSKQHDKRVAFASSGWTSMRAYMTVTQLQGLLVLLPVLVIIGATLGLLGAVVFRPRPSGTANPMG
jgi:hypothetical protein